ncbi:hypothetical protein ADL02_06770 [Streptomyces sp. NRRL WC-3723]|nr:hypothetical protein ADL02_06770 [Streptomyces sp. NRRL WC-3723]
MCDRAWVVAVRDRIGYWCWWLRQGTVLVETALDVALVKRVSGSLGADVQDLTQRLPGDAPTAGHQHDARGDGVGTSMHLDGVLEDLGSGGMVAVRQQADQVPKLLLRVVSKFE